MTGDQWLRLLATVTQLIGVLVWPALLVFFLVFFRSSLSSFFSNLGELSFKAPGLEASAKRRDEAAAALGAAEAVRSSPGDTTRSTVDPRYIAEALPSSRVLRRILGSQVLWVDDRPGNNVFERQALEALGIRIDLSISTEDALEKMRRRSFDLVISDMGRPPDERAGYTLLGEMRSSGSVTPVVIYSGSRAPEHVREAIRNGAIGATNSPQELISIVTRTLASS